MWRRIIAVAAVVLVLGAAGVRPAAGQYEGRQEEMGPAASFGWGMAAVGTNLLYIPCKVVYAVGGSITALLAWGLSAGNGDVAMGVLQPALGGTWVVTPQMLRGEDPIMYNGPSYEPPHDR